MKLRRARYLGWIITGCIIAIVIIVLLLPKPIVVEQITVTRQNLQTTIAADAVVQVRDRFVVAMPATGVLERMSIDVGDSVAIGQVIGTVIPPQIDARQRAEAQARIAALQAAVNEVRQRRAALRPLVEQARRRAERLGRLLASGAVAREQSENAIDVYEQLQREADALEARESASAFELESARAMLAAPPGQRVAVRSPLRGVVLRRFEKSERTIMAGTPIAEVGDTSRTEVVIDVLSVDAVKVRSGMTVLFDGWGGGQALRGMVRRIEPAARTKVSSLGIEEQRVNVVADILNRPPTLGDGYRVEAAIVVEQLANALCIPLGALLRDGEQWNVLVNDGGILRRRAVTLGARNAIMTSVTSGLAEGDRVIEHPSESLREGDRVQASEN